LQPVEFFAGEICFQIKKIKIINTFIIFTTALVVAWRSGQRICLKN
jgi:hypothetical protein